MRRRWLSISRRVVAAPLLWDEFTGTDGTLLSSHTPNVGGPWAILKPFSYSGTMGIYGNRARATIGNDPVGYGVNVGKSDVVITVDGTFSAIVNGTYHYIMVRMTDGENGWYIEAVKGSSILSIYQVTAGVRVLRSRTTISVGNGQTWSYIVTLSGTSIGVSMSRLGTTYTTQYSSSAYQTNTIHGIYLFTSGADDTYFDNMRIEG